MIKQTSGFLSAAIVAMALAMGTAMTPTTAVAAGIKAAYVETVIPSKPYLVSFFPDRGTGINFIGPYTGVLGISSLTITNTSATLRWVTFYNSLIYFPGATNCNSPTFSLGGPLTSLMVQGKSTLHIPFPSPLVINPVNGPTCVAVEGSPDLLILVNGFVN